MTADVLVVVALLLVGAAGTAVVRSSDPAGQAVTLSLSGLALTVLFVVLQAPDVALAQVAVGSAVVPLMVTLGVRTTRTFAARHRRRKRT